ncbi:hypothetical protein JCM3770_000947 [Rhodotorula araucariae]
MSVAYRGGGLSGCSSRFFTLPNPADQPLASTHLTRNTPPSATEADRFAVHRILLFLPPGTPIRHNALARPAPPAPPIRNSLIFYDAGTQSVVAALPLSTDVDSPPCPPLTSSPLVSHSHVAPSPSYHPSAAGFAAYIDHIATTLHPNHTLQAICREVQACKDEIRRLVAEEDAADERRPGPPAMVDPLARVEAERLTWYGGEDQPIWRDEGRQLDWGFARLDVETELACPRAADGGHSLAVRAGTGFSTCQKSRPASSWTVSSFATFGTERFVTADEGEDDTPCEASRRTSLSSDTNAAGFSDTAVASCATEVILPSAPLDEGHSPVQAFNPAATLTNGNAVLLSFLGAPSSVIRAPPVSRGIIVSAHHLSAEQASEMEDHGEIERAEVDMPTADTNSEEPRLASWWDWLAVLVSGAERKEPLGDNQGKGKSGWFAWLSPVFFAFKPGTPPSPTRVGITEREPRTAGAEATSRLSVFHFDETGTVRRAFITRR